MFACRWVWQHYWGAQRQFLVDRDHGEALSILSYIAHTKACYTCIATKASRRRCWLTRLPRTRVRMNSSMKNIPDSRLGQLASMHGRSPCVVAECTRVLPQALVTPQVLRNVVVGSRVCRWKILYAADCGSDQPRMHACTVPMCSSSLDDSSAKPCHL